MGKLRILGAEGDTAVAWDAADPATVDAARKRFDALVKGRGFTAWSVAEGARTGEAVREFDPDAFKIIVAAPMRGG